MFGYQAPKQIIWYLYQAGYALVLWLDNNNFDFQINIENLMILRLVKKIRLSNLYS